MKDIESRLLLCAKSITKIDNMLGELTSQVCEALQAINENIERIDNNIAELSKQIDLIDFPLE